jgi:uncharacterized OB-fold protein
MITPKYTREIPQRYRLEAGKCSECGYLAFPPRLVCPECGNREFETVKLDPTGTIVSFTVIRVPPDDFADEVPIPIAIVETDNGGRLTAQVVDCSPDEVEIGKKVRLMFRRITSEGHAGIHQYAYKAVLER